MWAADFVPRQTTVAEARDAGEVVLQRGAVLSGRLLVDGKPPRWKHTLSGTIRPDFTWPDAVRTSLRLPDELACDRDGRFELDGLPPHDRVFLMEPADLLWDRRLSASLAERGVVVKERWGDIWGLALPQPMRDLELHAVSLPTVVFRADVVAGVPVRLVLEKDR